MPWFVPCVANLPPLTLWLSRMSGVLVVRWWRHTVNHVVTISPTISGGGGKTCTLVNMVYNYYTIAILRTINFIVELPDWGPKWARLTPNGTNPGLFQIRFQYILARVLKSDLKKPRVCPIWSQSGPLWVQTWSSCSSHLVAYNKFLLH